MWASQCVIDGRVRANMKSRHALGSFVFEDVRQTLLNVGPRN